MTWHLNHRRFAVHDSTVFDISKSSRLTLFSFERKMEMEGKNLRNSTYDAGKCMFTQLECSADTAKTLIQPSKPKSDEFDGKNYFAIILNIFAFWSNCGLNFRTKKILDLRFNFLKSKFNLHRIVFICNENTMRWTVFIVARKIRCIFWVTMIPF